MLRSSLKSLTLSLTPDICQYRPAVDYQFFKENGNYVANQRLFYENFNNTQICGSGGKF